LFYWVKDLGTSLICVIWSAQDVPLEIYHTMPILQAYSVSMESTNCGPQIRVLRDFQAFVFETYSSGKPIDNVNLLTERRDFLKIHCYL